MNKDPLSDLLLNAQEVDRSILALALQDILGIDNKTGKVILKPGFNKLNSRQKVVAYLLGKKVAKLLGKIENETIAPKDIPVDTGIPKGTVYPKLRELIEDRLVMQTKEGEYYIESHQIIACIDVLGKKEET